MNKPQPNEDQKINASWPKPPKDKEFEKIRGETHGLNQPKPEIVKACLAATKAKTKENNKPHPTPQSGKSISLSTSSSFPFEVRSVVFKSKGFHKTKLSKVKLNEGTLGHIFQSMEKLSNAICLENGLYRRTDLTNVEAIAKGKPSRKALRLAHLARKKKGSFAVNF